ncbi:hypothetical protein DPMN_070553 [Dreissena polymorpha]|uniref:Uncharacterized protein n=1 Tax=Dreissena polymorpha TaxID=45954 RepID=A0A9D3Z3C0_DREPO|nr:hypothetical protein DPMN_070553 [Dreissena polymorpha]
MSVAEDTLAPKIDLCCKDLGSVKENAGKDLPNLAKRDSSAVVTVTPVTLGK